LSTYPKSSTRTRRGTTRAKRAAKAIYRRRRKTYPPLPKSLAETHEVLPKMNIQTNKFEDFLQINDIEKGMIMFTYQKNLECLSELFMDGIYKCCPKLKIGKKRGHLSGTYFIDNM
jgi:hypothetical protein